MPRKALGPGRGSVNICWTEEQSALKGDPEETGTADSSPFGSWVFPATIASAFAAHRSHCEGQDALLKETPMADAPDRRLSYSALEPKRTDDANSSCNCS